MSISVVLSFLVVASFEGVLIRGLPHYHTHLLPKAPDTHTHPSPKTSHCQRLCLLDAIHEVVHLVKELLALSRLQALMGLPDITYHSTQLGLEGGRGTLNGGGLL